MERPAMNQPSDLWEVDGSLRDVYVHGTSLSDWRAFMEIVRRHQYHYTRDGESFDLPEVDFIFASRDVGHCLHVHVGSTQVNCHFFDTKEIELDIDPREVKDIDTHNLLLDFLERISGVTKKQLAITAENSPHLRLLTYDPARKSWTVHELQSMSTDA